MGGSTIASGPYSLSGGYGTIASGPESVALGLSTQATNFGSFAWGGNTLAGGNFAFAGGEFTVATGTVAVAIGNATIAGGDNSTALGDNTVALRDDSVALGYHSKANGTASIAAGNFAEANHDNTFVWADGNGTTFASTADNQFLIRAAAVGIGTNNPAAQLHVAGNTIFSGAATLGGSTIFGSATNVPTANAILVPTGSYMVLNPAGPVTLNTSLAIADVSAPGTLLILRGSSDVNTVTINDNANTALGANRVLGLNDTLTLVYNGDIWVEIAFANN
jgi:hypothetical protein